MGAVIDIDHWKVQQLTHVELKFSNHNLLCNFCCA